MKKPLIFVACSDNGIQIANELQVNLNQFSYPILESQCIGHGMKDKRDTIMDALKKVDFGVVILTAQDISSGVENVAFLIGLICGTLGKNRYVVLTETGIQLNQVTKYLNGIEPLRYDTGHPNLVAALGPVATRIKQCLNDVGGKRKILDDIDRRKELLRVALDSFSCSTQVYDPVLAELIKQFNCSVNNLVNADIRGATLFAFNGKEELHQIGCSGTLKSNHCFNISEKDKYVVKCYEQQQLVLGEKKDLYDDEDSSLYEYIFCCPINNVAILTVHIMTNQHIDTHTETAILSELEANNAGLISVFRLLLKGGVRYEEKEPSSS